MSSKLTAIDLFSGAGGFSLAANNLQINVLTAIELDKQAAETYHLNLVEKLGAQTQVFAEDINTVDIDSLMRYQGLGRGELDILLGGPPCQGFSSHRINNAGENDPRNQLLLRYFDFVEKLRPKAFLVENVPGLLWKRHESFLNRFLELAKENQYRVVSGGPLIMNAKDYGVPQNRRRAFILAVRQDIAIDHFQWPPKATHSKIGEQSFETASTIFEKPSNTVLAEFRNRLVQRFDFSETEAIRCVNALKWGKKVNEDDPCNIHMTHSAELTQLFKNTPLIGSRDESGRTLDCHKDYAGHKDVYGRIFPHTPSNTITTGCNNPSKGRFVHPWLPHGITLRHAARLQTFPDDFDFSGGTMAAARQIGNAVPVKLGEALIAAIQSLLTTSK
ncbi:DNA cytosine methyltransferase [Shewanella glacialipiscicola]|uniref:DNA cytosine methyltransferase n=1 Tax=Shewanella glacialipiscicola TaxID=614069 RepID=UPI003D79111B